MSKQTWTVLVVDDEAPMRALERRILAHGPYAVLEASGAAEALGILQSGRHIDLLIADLEMPDVSGEELVRRIHAVRHGQKVLYVSGHVDRLLDARQVLGDGEAFVDKPFTAKALLEGVSLLLFNSLTPPR
jgi:two-component system, cell cycle sensor histidine kinase and response regulator CckA